jgi:hypothetical protein
MSRPTSRKLLRIAPSVAAIALAVAVAACNGDSPTSSAPAAPTALRKLLVDPPQTATVLKRTVPLKHDFTASVVVGPTGGAINIDSAGFHLNIPKSSLPSTKPITITVTALAGDEVAYTFSPHGLKFKQAISATQDLYYTTWNGHTGVEELQAVYFADDSLLNLQDGTVTVAETFPTTMVASGQRVHWGIPHFSGYAIASKKPTSY